MDPCAGRFTIRTSIGRMILFIRRKVGEDHLTKFWRWKHIIRHGGGQVHIENLHSLCAHCNRVKGNRAQESLVARLRELGNAA